MCAGRQSPRAIARKLIIRLLLPQHESTRYRRENVANAENHLIHLLPRKDRAHLLGVCEPVELAMSKILCEPGNPTQHIYFPTEGFVSLVGLNNGSPDLEIGMVGREGMLGAQVALGVATTPLRARVQGAGRAWRIGIAAFRRELTRSAALRRNIDRYIYVLMAQMATSAACPRFHQIGPRLARCLLMSQDRAHDSNFQVTQEVLAYRLGVRRVGITAAAGVLQNDGLIEYRRGDLTVLDRRGLEAVACSCYATDRKAYAELLQ